MSAPHLRRYAWLAIVAALLTLSLKTAAWLVTHSVGMLSDALESIVNVAAAVMALTIITIAARPADDDHAYGHSKAEYFASGVEGTLIFIAALSIIGSAAPRLLQPHPLQQVGLGLILALLASLINLMVAWVLIKAGKTHRSITLEADGHHLLTDVWTSAGVVVGLIAVTVTGWHILDPLIAIGVALNILWTGWHLIKRSIDGLMDAALPSADIEQIQRILQRYVEHDGICYCALKTRQAGARKFVSVNILVPGTWLVQQGHELLDRLETDIEQHIEGSQVFSHLEPIEAPSKHHH